MDGSLFRSFLHHVSKTCSRDCFSKHNRYHFSTTAWDPDQWIVSMAAKSLLELDPFAADLGPSADTLECTA